jgi:hypothetical protein
MTRRVFVVAALVAVIAAFSWHVWGPAHTPPPQPPLETLRAQNFSDFERTFDDAAGNVRMILLLSPT